jgi:hypothetical protein
MSKSTSPKRRRNPPERKGQNVQVICRESGGKHGFRRKKQALTKLNRLKVSDFGGPDRATRVYKCPHCGDWHLTSSPERG